MRLAGVATLAMILPFPVLMAFLTCWQARINAVNTQVLHLAYGHNLIQQQLDRNAQRRRREAERAVRPRPYTKQGDLNVGARELFFGMPEEKWKRTVRMSKASFCRLLTELKLSDAKITLGKRGGGGGCNRYDAHVRLGAALYHWASGENLHLTALAMGQVSDRTVQNWVDEVAEAIRQHICPVYGKWPSKKTMEDDAGRWEAWCGMNAVVGALDGCHIEIRPRDWNGHNPADFHNYKGFHSAILMAICDFDADDDGWWRGRAFLYRAWWGQTQYGAHKEYNKRDMSTARAQQWMERCVQQAVHNQRRRRGGGSKQNGPLCLGNCVWEPAANGSRDGPGSGNIILHHFVTRKSQVQRKVTRPPATPVTKKM